MPNEVCKWCGPVCYGGAAHNARVEDNCPYTKDKPMNHDAQTRNMPFPPMPETPKRPQLHLMDIKSVTGSWYAYNATEADAYIAHLEARLRELEAYHLTAVFALMAYSSLTEEQVREVLKGAEA